MSGHDAHDDIRARRVYEDPMAVWRRRFKTALWVLVALWGTNQLMAPLLAERTCRKTGIASYAMGSLGFSMRVTCRAPVPATATGFTPAPAQP